MSDANVLPVLPPPAGDPVSHFLIFGGGPMSEAFLRHLIQMHARKTGEVRGAISALFREPKEAQWMGPIVIVTPKGRDSYSGEEIRALDHSFRFDQQLGSPEDLVTKMEPFILMCLNFEAYHAAISPDGYKLKLNNPDIVHDLNLKEDENPRTVYGAVMRVIQHHFWKSTERLVFYFTENSHENPLSLFEQFLAAMNWKTDDLVQHFAADVEMVVAMMDRIVPKLTEQQQHQFETLFRPSVPTKFLLTEQFGFVAFPVTNAPHISWKHDLTWYVRFIPDDKRADYQFLKRYFSIAHQTAALIAAEISGGEVHRFEEFPLAGELTMLRIQEMQTVWPPVDGQYVSEINWRITVPLGDTSVRVLRDMGSRKIPIILMMCLDYFESKEELPLSLVLVVAKWIGNLDKDYLSSDKAFNAMQVVSARLSEWLPTNDATRFAEIFASLSDATTLPTYREASENVVLMETVADLVRVLAEPDGLLKATQKVSDNGFAQLRKRW